MAAPKFRPKTTAFFVITTLLWAPSLAYCQAGSPEEMLNLLEGYFTKNEKVEFSSEERRFDTGWPDSLGSSKPAAVEKLRIWRDGDKWKFHGTRERYYNDGTRLAQSISDIEQVLKGDESIVVSKEDGRPASALGYQKNVADSHRVGMLARAACIPIHGMFRGNLPLSIVGVLRSGEVRVVDERFEGRPIRVLRAKNQWGSIEVWLDPRADFIPVRIKQQKGPTDWVTQNQPVNAIVGTPQKNQARRTGIETEYIVHRIEMVDGGPIPGQFTFVYRTQYEDGRITENRSEVSISNFRRRPDWSEDVFVITTAPDGTRFTDQNEPHITREYRDGKIVKVVNEESLERLRGNRFQRGRWLDRGLLLIVGFSAVILVLAGFAAWRRRRAEE